MKKKILIAVLLCCSGCQLYKGKASTYLNGLLVNRQEFTVIILGSTAMRDGLKVGMENFFTAEIESSEITPEKFAEILRESTPFLEAFRAVMGGL